jgi:beta-lactamase superfamily II metal-dependent hydrolase
VRFSLDVRRARKGDCLLVHYGTDAKPRLVLVDGGPSQVYKPHLKPRLGEIRKARGLAKTDALPIDLMMVSHIDDDHIRGILELTKELIEATSSGKPLAVRIRSLWHNSFDDIIGNSPDELLAGFTTSFAAAAGMGEVVPEAMAPETAKVLASVAQGFRLRDDAKRLKLKVNTEFGGGLAMASKGGTSVDMGDGLELTLVGPLKAELVELQEEHDKFLQKSKAEQGTEAALAAFSDTSVANLSSIVVLAEAGGKTMLLTGDARGDKILKGLETVGLLKKGKSLHVDVLKGPHHGSDRNVAPAFFKRVTADHYVFSGDGEHGNPERETLQMLKDARGSDDYEVHLTYPIAEIDVERKKDWNKERKSEKARKVKKPSVKVRPVWSAKKHSLAGLLSANPAFKKKVRIVKVGAPHVIDLLDPLGF